MSNLYDIPEVAALNSRQGMVRIPPEVDVPMTDRVRQISDAFLRPRIHGLKRGRIPKVHYVTLTEYDKNYDCSVIFPPERLKMVLGEAAAKVGLKQLRIAETEKYPHVTYFFNGGVEKPNKGEDRARILAGLFDAVCENVTTLLKPGTTPARVVLGGGVSRSARVRKTFARTLARSGMHLEPSAADDALYLDALGCAIMASQRPMPLPPLEKLHVVPGQVD